jgi:quercetin dioxygenase-like cupin family protein
VELKEWVTHNKIEAAKAGFENRFISELSSTNKVINFIVTAKKGHEQEVHEDFIEYLYIIEGTCTMNFDGIEIAYSPGDIISILLNIKHTAVVTSEQPMLALVQQQFCF